MAKRMTSRRARLAALLAMVALLASACGGTSDGGGGGTEGSSQVRLATLAPSSLLWLHAIAKDQSMYAKHGVEIEEVQVQNSSALVQAVSSGSADAGVALGDNAVRAIDQGAKITISGAILGKSVLRLYAGNGVAGAAQMAGGRVTAGAVEGGTTDLLLHQLQKLGVSKDQVELMALPNSRDRVVALENGEVQGALLIPPFDAMAEAAGATFIDWYDEPYVQTPLILNTRWAADNPEAAKGVTGAMRQAAQWIYDPANREQAVKVLAEYAAGGDVASAEAAYEFMVVDGQTISRDLTVPPDGLNNIVQVTASVSGKPAAALDESKYYDPSFLEE
jgi:ABC-type nitrate/sulfonate/bicarbonate transport system substrate-binding protein